jgi:hypothetical protein
MFHRRLRNALAGSSEEADPVSFARRAERLRGCVRQGWPGLTASAEKQGPPHPEVPREHEG